MAFAVFLLVAESLRWSAAHAFPPYRSTDADTAEPGTLELRAGMLEIERAQGRNTFTTPLLRMNIGLPAHLEINSELEYVPREERVGDAAIGLKWAPIRGAPAVGVEMLALLPVRDNQKGLGFEGQLLVTFECRDAVVHVNGGGFYDPRPEPTEAGWRGSVLVELPLGRVRPGAEAFAKQELGKSVDGRLGLGAIVDLGRFDVRAGLHAGVTQEVPVWVFSLWITTKLPIW